jgi:uncharacterized protein (TIGR02001 family)
VLTQNPSFSLRPRALCAAVLLAATPFVHALDGGAYASAIDAARASDPLDARVSVAPRYVARGLARDGGRPALQAGVDYGRPEGWRAGARASTVDGRHVGKSTVEMDLHAGYSRKVGELGYSAGAAWYRYPGARLANGAGPDYSELATGLSWKTLYAKYHYALSRDYLGVPDARGSGYLDLGAGHAFESGVLLKLHAGDGRVAGAGNTAWNWRDMAAGLSTRLEGGWTAAVNLSRAIGGAGGSAIYERYSSGNLRADGRPWAASAGRRGLVLSLSRRF